ncbi:MAG: cyclic pyranopterin phosphate synthase [Saprospiraceae bacterium]|jgi:cyclic pyranopterin phosphate synthase
MENKFSHIDPKGNPTMVDVGDKKVTKRTAQAQSIVRLSDDVIESLQKNDGLSKKGPVFQTAILAGIMAAKKTHELIPLCHPLPLNKCSIDISIKENNEVFIDSWVSTSGKTGVEMEALTGASIAALTIYDMCKSMGHDIVIVNTQLIVKTGGKSDYKKA